MERAEFNACMRPYMQGRKSKQERSQSMCIGAKLCTGKAKTPDEAATICSQPKLPKWVGKDKDTETLCSVKSQRIPKTLDAIALQVKSGETDQLKPTISQLVHDVYACASDEKKRLAANSLATAANDIIGRPYLKAEGRDVLKAIELLQSTLGA